MNPQALKTPETPLDPKQKMRDLVALCKRRGFVFQASEIYGGLNGFWDYGPLGVLLKNNLRDRWWRDMVLTPPLGPDGRPLQIVGVDSSIIQHPSTWVASGHVAGFSDPMVDCRETKQRYRADHVVIFKPKDGSTPWLAMLEGAEDVEIEKRLKKIKKSPDEVDSIPLTTIEAADYAHILGPDASKPGTLTEPRAFNLMFQTYVGAIQNEDSKAYLRPETAQGIFLNFKNVLDSSRVKMPFGIAQIGKSFRNEVTPRNYIFRSREFEQMELEWFCPPEEAKEWFNFWVAARANWWESVGISSGNLQKRKHEADELSHYAKAGAGTFDIEYKFPFTDPGFGELEGIAHRCDFDLTAHAGHSKTKIDYFDDATQKRYTPHVIEPAAGLTRGVLALLAEAYTPDASRPSQVFMKFSPEMAPIKAAILPLVAKDGMPELAQKLYMDLRAHFTVELDIKQNIGKRYARHDEIGTPYCLTIDNESLTDQTLTVRHRDTMAQERISISQVKEFLNNKI